MSNELNVFAGGSQEMGQPVGAAASMMISRQAQEVQAAMIVAKRFPRDEKAAADRILAACTRPSLAEDAVYEYPRGGKTVTGPSIRLAEVLAQNWGNIDFGFIELEQKNGESQVMAYAWDLETNTRQCKIFSVPHVRHTTNGDYALTDPRDIYELVANQAARRVRSCILGVIPGDAVEMALKQCDVTLKSSSNDPLDVRIKSMAECFKAEFSITEEMLAGYIGKKVEAFTEADVIRLRKVYRSLKDGVIGSNYFTERMKNSVAESAEPEPKAAGDPAEQTTPADDQAPAGTQVNLDDL